MRVKDFERVYYIKDGHLEEKIKLPGGLLINKLYVPFICAESEYKYDEKYEELKEARYSIFIKKLMEGVSLSNFRSSKYYMYYLERLKEEHPEYLI